MGFFDSIFGSKEQEVKDLWMKLNRMESEQLLDIIKARPTTIHGRLAFVALFREQKYLATKLVNESDKGRDLIMLVKALAKTDVILLGEGDEFQEIRNTVKLISSEWPDIPG